MKVIYLNKFFFAVVIILLVTTLVIFNVSSVSSYNEISVDKIISKENLSGRQLDIQNAFDQKKLIAITFDDGPGVYTQFLLDELEKREVPATFFILGLSTKNHSDLLSNISKNNEIALHGYSHRLFTKLSNEEVLEEIHKTEEIIKTCTNISPKIVRAPYGSLNNKIKSLLKENGYTFVNWTVDSKDWSYRNVEKTYNHVLKNVKGNDIILMHDIYKTSVDASIKLIDYYISKGYMFVTVSELLQAKGEY